MRKKILWKQWDENLKNNFDRLFRFHFLFDSSLVSLLMKYFTVWFFQNFYSRVLQKCGYLFVFFDWHHTVRTMFEWKLWMIFSWLNLNQWILNYFSKHDIIMLHNQWLLTMLKNKERILKNTGEIFLYIEWIKDCDVNKNYYRTRLNRPRSVYWLLTFLGSDFELSNCKNLYKTSTNLTETS